MNKEIQGLRVTEVIAVKRQYKEKVQFRCLEIDLNRHLGCLPREWHYGGATEVVADSYSVCGAKGGLPSRPVGRRDAFPR